MSEEDWRERPQHGMRREAVAGEREAKDLMERRKKGERPCTSTGTQLISSDSAFSLGSSDCCLLNFNPEDSTRDPI